MMDNLTAPLALWVEHGREILDTRMPTDPEKAYRLCTTKLRVEPSILRRRNGFRGHAAGSWSYRWPQTAQA